MKAGITKRQQTCLTFIKHYIKQHEYSPTLKEIMGAINAKSPSGVHALLKGLEMRGYIKQIPAQARSISVVDNQLPKPIARAIKALGKAETLHEMQNGRDALMKLAEKYNG